MRAPTELERPLRALVAALPTEDQPGRVDLTSPSGRRQFLERLWPGAAWLLPALAVTFYVHWKGFAGWPGRENFDEGIYTSQAWAMLYRRALTPFSYFYDHPAGGWAWMAAYIGLTGAFHRATNTLVAARESMLLAHMVSSALLYALARRLKFRRAFAALALLLFSLSPVGLAYQRFAFLDNVVVLWLLAGLFFLASPHRSARSGLAAGFCFGMAFWAKETMIILTPALMLFFWDHTDPRNRKVRACAHFGLYWGLVFAYPLFAWVKDELFPGPGHVSLIGTFLWQLHGRAPTGSLLDAASDSHRMALEWLHGDPVILGAGLLLAPVALLSKRLRAVAVMSLIQVAWMCRNGYLPFAYVTLFFPLGALIIAGLADSIWGGWRRQPRMAAYALRTSLVVGLVVAVGVALPLVRPTLARAMSAPAYRAPQEAVAYTMRHVPKDAVLVVDNDTFTDFALRGWWPFPMDKLELDPAVRQDRVSSWRDIDYLLIGKLSDGDKQSYPMTTTAVEHSKVIASFRFGNDTLVLRKVVPSAPG